MIHVFVTLEDLYDTCFLSMLHWRICMIHVHVFANVTLDDLIDTCVFKLYIRGFL